MQNSHLSPQNVEFTTLASEEFETRKFTSSRFIKLTRRSHLQSMDAGISSWLSKLQKEFSKVSGRDQETKHGRKDIKSTL